MRMNVCPRCSKPVEAKDFPASFLILMGGVDPRFRCSRCGYRGPYIVLSDEEMRDDGREAGR